MNNSIIKLYLFSIFLLIAIVIVSCYQAPVTGRSQLILIPESEEIKMGLLAYQEALKDEKISTNYKYNKSVKRVGQRIAAVSGKSGYEWEYNVIEDDDTINAFALPGGKIAVYTGILPIAQTDAGLATVMGHEVAHATARHGGERISAGILAQLGAAGLNVALKNQDPAVISAINSAFGLGVTVGGILPFSRKQESEADRIGLVYMSKAGYDPRESLYFWKRMNEATKDKPKPPEFLSTHPNYGTRMKNLNTWMPEALNIYKSSNKAVNHQIAMIVQ